MTVWIKFNKLFNPLSANPAKWSNTLKQFKQFESLKSLSFTLYFYIYTCKCILFTVVVLWSISLGLFINLPLTSVSANICELNLVRSFKYGGRKHSSSNHGVFMLMVRLRHCFNLIFLFLVFQQDILQK